MKKKNLKVNLLAGSILTFGVVLVVAFIFMIMIMVNMESENRKLWEVFMVIEFILLSFALVFFFAYVYRPVKKLQETIYQLKSINKRNPMNFEANPNSIADSINTLLEELRLSIEREHEEVMLRHQSQYAELQNQINPHFLYNTLETIRGQAVIDNNYKIADMTEALAKYFRYNISKDNDTVTVEQELENIRNYIQIQQYRFQSRFIFRIYPHSDYVEYAHCLMPKMTLQPIVENAIFHGMEEKLEMVHISIHIEATSERLIILVIDDGMGMDELTLHHLNEKLRQKEDSNRIAKAQGHHGIAMRNVNNRIRLLYGEDYGVRVSSTKDLGTEVEITLPKIKREEKQDEIWKMKS